MDNEVRKYIESIDDGARRKDIYSLVALITKASNEPPKMWESSIISFGLYQYKYESGREGEAPKIGLSNRKQAITLYGLHTSDNNHPNSTLLEKLGKYKTGKGCLYVSTLADINTVVLEEIIRNLYSKPIY